MRALIKKEWLYSVRNYKLLILLLFFVLYAMLTPVMVNYILPMVLRGQFPGLSDEDLLVFIDMTQSGSIRSYIGDIFELGIIIITFTICGIMSQDINENTLVLPICSGKSYKNIILSKFVVFGSILFFASVIGTLITYLYSGIIFEYAVSFALIFTTALLLGLFMIFSVSLIIFVGTITKKAIPTGLVSIVLLYGLVYLGSLLNITKYLPSGLITEASALETIYFSNIWLSILVTILSTTLLLFGSYLLLLKNEWNTRS